MQAMILERIQNLDEEKYPLRMVDRPVPQPGTDEVLLRVRTCGVCHTELDEIEGRTPPAFFPIVLGHQVIATIAEAGSGVTTFKAGERVGVAWINSTCGRCEFCLGGRENVCPHFRATGRDNDGGYAEYMKIGQSYLYRIPEIFDDAEAAPLLCAGAIGYRSLKLSGIRNDQVLGLSGFGASGHLVLMLSRACYPRTRIYVFARSKQERDFALELGAAWAGDSDESPPTPVHAMIDTTPAWKPVLEALKNLHSGGRLVINAIRKENFDRDYLLQMNYPVHLWMEKEIKSVANITRSDVVEFLNLAAQTPIRPEYQEYTLAEANRALLDLKHRRIRGAKVLKIG
jgi:alcohol dehydrogenase, propanol-preferring